LNFERREWNGYRPVPYFMINPIEQMRLSYDETLDRLSIEQENRALERRVRAQKKMIRTLTRQLAAANKFRVRYMTDN